MDGNRKEVDSGNEEAEEGLTYQGRPRTWGMRFSLVDGIVLVIAFLATIFLYQITFGYSLFILFVVLHFFLFCNVFRVRRNPELIWATIFVLNCGVWGVAFSGSLLTSCGLQLLVTAGLILNELRCPSYHGIFAKKLNPRLDDYLVGRI